MAYDLSRFSTQSFERFAQDLALSQFGPATQIYGAGGDGAREATFEGAFTPFGEDEPRTGYVVVQAKYLAKPKTPAENLAWLKKQCDAEFAKFKSTRRRLRPPEFYILVTNVTLTPGAKNADGKYGGTLDDMLEYLESWRRELGVKEVWAWHADVLTALLDATPTLRTTFGPWVLPGDVLSAMLQSFSVPDFSSVIQRVVRNELKDQRGVKTQDSGQATGQQIYIDEVFVDLPLNPSTVFAPLALNWEGFSADDDDDDHNDPSMEPEDSDGVEDDALEWEDVVQNWNIINTLMERLSDRLSPPACTEPPERFPAYQKLVVLGGPGQGKSTIGQFLAQLLRARLVATGPGAPSEVATVARNTLQRAEAEGISLTGPLRFPIHIALPRYADTISRAGEDEAPSLLRYVARNFARIAEETIEPKLLREWLGHYPSVIVLDGLDEVPRTGNRGDVIRQIERLVGEIHEAQADTLIVVTSRPQGYLNDLDKKHWTHWSLADLDPANAIRFADRLGKVLISDPHRQAEVLTILTEAAEDGSTAPLMISPLQVSLLFTLVQTSNNIPKDRWTLFERHYETLRDREIAKGGVNGDLIRQYKSEIDRLHFDAGFILQVRAEKQGNASAHFTLREFKSLIARNLKASILDPQECERVAARILDVATNRLVFLGDRNEGRIAFDVRSLQEFMAAARIMVSPESRIKARLIDIAYRSHWSHVFRIACSKVYAETSLEEFREEILAILDRLDEGDDGGDYQAIRAGARMAIALLTDSTAGARQTDRAKLMARAVRVLELESTDFIGGLANVADAVTLTTLGRAIEDNLRNVGGPLFINSLRLLLTLARSEDHPLSSWARERLPEPSDLQRREALALASLALPATLLPQDAAYQRDLIWRAGPVAARRMPAPRAEVEIAAFHVVASTVFDDGDTIALMAEGRAIDGVQVLFKPIRCFARLKLSLPRDIKPDSGWPLVAAAVAFSRAPDLETLVAAVSLAKADGMPDGIVSELPWPIATLVMLARKTSAEEIERRLASGEFGGVDAMIQAEKMWKTEGLELTNAPMMRRDAFDADSVGRYGPPVRRWRKNSHARETIPVFLAASATWSPEARLGLLQLLPFLADQIDDAERVVAWLSPDLLEADWDLITTRRMAGLLRLALRRPENSQSVKALRLKIPGQTMPMSGLSTVVIPEGLLNLLRDPETAEWAALAIFAALPSTLKKIQAALATVESRHLMTPRNASPDHARALAGLRAIAGLTERGQCAAEAEALLAPPLQNASSVLRKIYRGQRENDGLEAVVCRAAELALERGLETRFGLIEIIAELVASRDSDFDNAVRLRELGLPEDVEREAETTEV